jgi:hypothetical protein
MRETASHSSSSVCLSIRFAVTQDFTDPRRRADRRSARQRLDHYQPGGSGQSIGNSGSGAASSFSFLLATYRRESRFPVDCLGRGFTESQYSARLGRPWRQSARMPASVAMRTHDQDLSGKCVPESRGFRPKRKPAPKSVDLLATTNVAKGSSRCR